MDTLVLSMLAETFIHPGMGSVGGAIDLPVAREAATHYPVIAGSSLKGALRDFFESSKPGSKDEINRLFGHEDSAGNILVSDARLLLLPVRSSSGSYKWITCGYLLERLQRDLARAKYPVGSFAASLPQSKHYYGGNEHAKTLFLEERRFEREAGLPILFTDVLSKLVPWEQTRKRLSTQVVILHDDDFAWFARYGLAVQARNKLNDKKQSDNLWYEETLPPDTLFYALIAGRTEHVLTSVQAQFVEHPYLQCGGNETVGQGWFALQWFEG
jgi:CRISPR-associated protein Cmr4